jgi:lysophospholipase L1-like esterase
MKSYWLLLLMALSSAPAFAAEEHWVATWSDPQPMVPRPPPAPPSTGAAPTQAPATARVDPAVLDIARHGFHDQTVRMVVHTSIAGSKLRIRLNSPFDSQQVLIGDVHIALRRAGSAIVPGSDRPVLFNGKSEIKIGPGMVRVSDPVTLTIPAQADVAVSLYLPQDTGVPSAHNGEHTSYVSKTGDAAGAAEIPDPLTIQNYYWLAGIDVTAPPKAAAIVTFGDSITEGARSTPDTDHAWPAVLSRRLADNPRTAQMAIANMGIGGNRLLHQETGASALARFDHDVLAQAGARWVVVLLGINDIGRADIDPVSADELIGGYRQLIERAHTHGLKVVGGTLPPYEGAPYARPEGESIREAVNDWIRHGGAFDAVVDFELATRDPGNPKRLRPEFDSGDHLHPSDAGYNAMAQAFDLSLFTR